jgi:murein DD-endopeptidase MepM/ murein hydrolase activator NlpD
MHKRTSYGSAASCVVFAIACASCAGEAAPPPSGRVVATSDVRLIPETFLVQAAVPRSATLDRLLLDHGVESDVAVRVVESVRSVFDPRRLRSQQQFLLERTLNGALRLFEYEIDGDSVLRVSPSEPASDTLKAEVVPIPKTIEYATVAGVIDRSSPSLFAAMNAAGERDELALRLAHLLSGAIDFNSQVQLGDQFAANYEEVHREGRPTGYGEITSAEYRQSDGRVVRAILFTPPGGQPQWYDEEGRSTRRFFLASPLQFNPRITSRFNPRRRHPVLNTIRAHRGVDYGAPTGAPVVAVADGTVVSVTTDRTNGRMVRLRHASGYQTYYLHLSRFGSGLRAGGRVSQGQVIGYVGSSGLATGPHLHYGLTKNGVFVDPLAEHRRMPPGEPIPASAMAEFRAVRDAELTKLAAAHVTPQPPTELASLE